MIFKKLFRFQVYFSKRTDSEIDIKKFKVPLMFSNNRLNLCRLGAKLNKCMKFKLLSLLNSLWYCLVPHLNDT